MGKLAKDSFIYILFSIYSRERVNRMGKEKKEIELVIFDLGKVILDFDHTFKYR